MARHRPGCGRGGVSAWVSGGGRMGIRRLGRFFYNRCTYLLVSKYLRRAMRSKPGRSVPKRGNPNAKEEIILLAEELIHERGFNAFSYNDIASIQQVRPAAIHYHFPTKSDLGVAVLNHELSRLALSEEKLRGLSGELQLREIIHNFYWTREAGWMCLIGAMTSDFSGLPEPVREKTGEICRTILRQVSTALEKERLEGRLQFKGKSADRALLFLSGLMSSMLLSRGLGPDVFQRMVDQMLRDMGSCWLLEDVVEGAGPPQGSDPLKGCATDLADLNT